MVLTRNKKADIFSTYSRVLIKSKETHQAHDIYPVEALMKQSLPEFLHWYIVASGAIQISVLRFGLLDVHPERTFLLRTNSSVWFQELKQTILDYFCLTSFLNAAPTSFHIIVSHLGNEQANDDHSPKEWRTMTDGISTTAHMLSIASTNTDLGRQTGTAPQTPFSPLQTDKPNYTTRYPLHVSNIYQLLNTNPLE
jgi:hypothetical protein